MLKVAVLVVLGLLAGCAQVQVVLDDAVVIRHEAGMPRPDDLAAQQCATKGRAAAWVSTVDVHPLLGVISAKSSTWRCS